MKKRLNNKTKPKRQPAPPQNSRSTIWMAVLTVAGAVFFFYYVFSGPSEQRTPVPQVRTSSTPSAGAQTADARDRALPPFHVDSETAKPFPVTLEPSRFSIPFVARAYGIAREIPDVLAQQPCYCNCGAFGHQSLLDCFASDHGANCSVCLKEAFLAEQMTKSGKTPQEVRDAVVKGLWRTVTLESL